MEDVPQDVMAEYDRLNDEMEELSGIHQIRVDELLEEGYNYDQIEEDQKIKNIYADMRSCGRRIEVIERQYPDIS